MNRREFIMSVAAATSVPVVSCGWGEAKDLEKNLGIALKSVRDCLI